MAGRAKRGRISTYTWQASSPVFTPSGRQYGALQPVAPRLSYAQADPERPAWRVTHLSKSPRHLCVHEPIPVNSGRAVRLIKRRAGRKCPMP